MSFRTKTSGPPSVHAIALFIANLFLYYHEIKWMKKVKEKDIRQARRFANLFRFIGGFNALFGVEEVEQSFK